MYFMNYDTATCFSPQGTIFRPQTSNYEAVTCKYLINIEIPGVPYHFLGVCVKATYTKIYIT